MLKRFIEYFLISGFLLFSNAYSAGLIVFQSDFGNKDGAVSAVKGVMYSVDKSLVVADLTNEITPFHIWEASYRLYQTAPYWPKETVFVSVVDPGVGTKRRSIVALSNNNQYFVTPDNGTLTLIADTLGIKAVRVIDESKNRLENSNASYTFHGRDVYGYTAAKLASGQINFTEVGPLLTEPLVKLVYQQATIKNNELHGTVVVLDTPYGNVWTNISQNLITNFGMKINERYQVQIYKQNILKYNKIVPFYQTFGNAKTGEDLLYVNSLLNLAIAINQGNFAKKYGIEGGNDWKIIIKAIKR